LIPSNLFDGGPTAGAEWFEVGSHEGEWRSREKLHQGVDAQNEHNRQVHSAVYVTENEEAIRVERQQQIQLLA
jgi:hypothetical protein